MRTPELAAFLGVALLLVVTPGQDTALTIQNTLLGGRAAGLLTAAGIALGQVTWTLVSCAGLTALLRASEPVFTGLRLAGAAYLVVLGGRALWGLARGGREAPPAAAGPGLRVGPAAALRQGLLSNLGNAKMLVFFTSLLPQFTTSASGLLGLGLVLCGLTLVWLSLYAAAVARAGALLRRRRVARALEALTGSVLVGLGLRVAASA